jgi:hypothetical protein
MQVSFTNCLPLRFTLFGDLFSQHNNLKGQDDVEEETAGHHFALY